MLGRAFRFKKSLETVGSVYGLYIHTYIHIICTNIKMTPDYREHFLFLLNILFIYLLERREWREEEGEKH